MKQEILPQLDNEKEHEIQNINKILKDFSACLNIVDTEHKRLSNFRNLGTYIDPVTYHIGEREEYRNINSTQTLVHVPLNSQFIPLRLVLTKSFEIPGLYYETMNYIQTLTTNDQIISNLIQASYWKEQLSTFEGKTVFPLIMYFDDYENNNPLGSHKGLCKTGAVYISIPALPPQYQAKIENIFLFILFNTIDRKVFKNKIIFTKAVEELNYLMEYGIEIKLACGLKRIYFKLVLFIGDNLGLHSILGLTESFKANVFCHHCLVTQTGKNKMFLENECILRTTKNYDELLALNDQKVTGIKEKCILHDIHDFHMAKNVCIDVMHDLLEGICRYDIAFILNNFIYVKKHFTLETFNLKLLGFDFGPRYNVNKPTELNEKSIKKGCVIMTSSEMLYLIQNFNLIIGDLIPSDDEHWNMYLLLKELVTIVMSDVLHPSTYKLLESIVFEYLSLCVNLSNGLKPKHHFLVHYPRCMKLFGPLWKISCIRYENKNQEGKNVSQSTTSRVNINRTIAIKHQLNLSYRFLTMKLRQPIFVSKNHKKKSINELEHYHQYFNLINKPNIVSVKSVNYYDKIIKKNSVLVKFLESGPIFQVVHEIIFDNLKYIFITKNLKDCYYDEKYQAYKIFNLNDFNWDKVEDNDVQYRKIVNMVLLPDSYYYISKIWM